MNLMNEFPPVIFFFTHIQIQNLWNELTCLQWSRKESGKIKSLKSFLSLSLWNIVGDFLLQQKTISKYDLLLVETKVNHHSMFKNLMGFSSNMSVLHM